MKKVLEVEPSSFGIEIVGAPPMSIAERAFLAAQSGIDISLAQVGREKLKVIDFAEASARLRPAVLEAK